MDFLKKERWRETLFAHIDKLALDFFVLDICKIYEKGGKRLLKNTVSFAFLHVLISLVVFGAKISSLAAKPP